MLYALTHEELRARLVTVNAGIYKRMAKDLAKAFSLTSLLSQPTTIKVGSIGANADYTTVVAGEQLTNSPTAGAVGGSGTLPRTGGTLDLLWPLALLGTGTALRRLRLRSRRV